MINHSETNKLKRHSISLLGFVMQVCLVLAVVVITLVNIMLVITEVVGRTLSLDLKELNCHKQCAPCNNHLSGNISNYRPALIEKIGQGKVDWIEGPHEVVKYTCQDLKEIELKYKEKIKELTESK